MHYSPLTVLALLGGTLLLYCSGLVIYRLVFDPLSKFPGPKLSAATFWYEFYYDVIKKGQFTFKIGEWHKQYGPIIRINPYEIHIDDPEGDFYHTVFSGTGVRDKHFWYASQFGTPESGLGTINHHLHRHRRRALNPSFSKASIVRLTPVIWSKIERLCSRFDEFRGTDQPVNVRLAYTCLTTDVITSYAFNRCWNHLDKPDFSPVWCKTLVNGSKMTRWTKQFPWMLETMKKMPQALVGFFDPGMLLVFDVMNKIHHQILDILNGKQEVEDSATDGLSKSPIPNRTIFHELLKSDLPDYDKTIHHLGQEGQNIIGAGADTTSNALTVITYHLLSNPRVLGKLKEELERAMPDRYGAWDLKVAESLPYLGGVIQEGLRLAYGASSRLTRVAPEEDLNFNGWFIQKGTPISMTALYMHHNEKIFPNSHTFLPERWTDAPDGGRSLDRYLVSFSKGSRQCIGINLAKVELFLTLATVFRRFEMDLHDTVFERDVQLKHDFFLPQPSMQSNGVRVIFK